MRLQRDLHRRGGFTPETARSLSEFVVRARRFARGDSGALAHAAAASRAYRRALTGDEPSWIAFVNAVSRLLAEVRHSSEERTFFEQIVRDNADLLEPAPA